MSKNTTASSAAPTADIAQVLTEWLALDAWIAKAKVQEAGFRQLLANHYFPEPKEGVNKVVIDLNGEQREFVMTHKINRTVDEGALEAVMPQLPEELRQLGVLIKYKPELVTSGFRTLTEGQLLIFSEAITEKPGLPALELKEAKFDPASDPATAPAIPDWPATNIRTKAEMVGGTMTKAQLTASGTSAKTGAKKAAKKGKK